MMTENTSNYFEILDLKPDANQHDIHMAYQKAKATYSLSNPDILNIFSEPELNDFRRLIDEAYSILKNQNYRSIYEKRMQDQVEDKSRISLESIKEASTDYQDISIVEHVSSKLKPDLIVKSQSYEKNDHFESEISANAEWTGDFLKKVREYKKISIDHLQEKTKVKPWYLKALENMDAKNLPAPVFVRGYVTQMAKELGLDDKQVADSYMKIYKSKLENNTSN